ncbi:hypothetical protein [Ferrimicrobium sp.]|uniref:hypothetical protein n=1 Tax=Ferrimicrobium sp. TaxID=2926050 RepID=UPI0026166409|nr:hypothetical protein [Ferrimicrobium sp.]
MSVVALSLGLASLGTGIGLTADYNAVTSPSDTGQVPALMASQDSLTPTLTAPLVTDTSENLADILPVAQGEVANPNIFCQPGGTCGSIQSFLDSTGQNESVSGPDDLHVCFESGYTLSRFGPVTFCGGQVDWSAIITYGGTTVGACGIGGGIFSAQNRAISKVQASNGRLFAVGCAGAAGAYVGVTGLQAFLQSLPLPAARPASVDPSNG